jgi:hypothetical protein
LGHDEVCFGRLDYRISRHESVKHHLASHLTSIPAMSVEVEPTMNADSARRNDIRLAGLGGDRAILAEEYDVKVLSLYAPTHQRGLAACRLEPNLTPLDDTVNRIRSVLAYQAKRKALALPTHPADAPPRVPFFPLVFSTGGVMEGTTAERLKGWKTWGMTTVTYSSMLTNVSIALAKARGRTFLVASQ